MSANLLFVPEAKRAGDARTAANALLSFGQRDVLGHSLFSIENAPVDGPPADASAALD